MPWLVGIDEAGYGPNLGPFVMSAVALRVQRPCAPHAPWQLLADVVRRADERDDGRLIVDDSKAVYSPQRGLAHLERNVWPFLSEMDDACTLQDLWRRFVLAPLAELEEEPWAEPDEPLPLDELPDRKERGEKLRRLFRHAGMELAWMRTCVVFPARFNAMLDHEDNKAVVPLYGLTQLLRSMPALADGEDVRITVDRLGGRQYYAEVLQQILPHRFVLASEETPSRSSYRLGDGQSISFLVEADRQCFCVALASMLSKYLREVLMAQFNRFWKRHQPELMPTAGYPLDAGRFWKDIEGTRERLGLAAGSLWRRK